MHASEGEAHEHFVDQYIDRQIDHYLGQIREKLDALKKRFSVVEQARKQAIEGPANGRRTARGDWKSALRGVAEEADALRKLMIFTLIDLKGNDDFKPQIEPHAAQNGFEKENQFIEEHIKKAEQGIDDYFFLPSNVVKLEELKGKNMASFLHRVREMARKIMEHL